MVKSEVGPTPVRNLVLVLGDQLDRASAAFDDFDCEADAVLMMEVEEVAAWVPQHKARLVLFLAAMRHLRDELRARGRTVAAALELGVPLEIREDRHFFCSPAEFAEFAAGRKNLLLESFYRRMRRKHGVLMDGERPLGGRWNFDPDNRKAFGKAGPGQIEAPRSFPPDEITRRVMELIERRFPDAPGSLRRFDYPVTPEQARSALRDFIKHRLARFGPYQDAMASGHPFIYHSRLSCALNLHLLDPRNAIEAACAALGAGRAPLNSVEAFVRQILGWREYVRGIYWLKMPAYAELNALNAELPMPALMWTGDTDMNCIRQSVVQLIHHAYVHHIQKLMVLGLFAMLLGVRPFDVHRWHMSMYADAIDWVSLPNVVCMSQFGDGRHRRQQALRGVRQLHLPDERLLSGLPLRPAPGGRRARLPVHHLLLGLAGAQPQQNRRQPEDALPAC